MERTATGRGNLRRKEVVLSPFPRYVINARCSGRIRNRWRNAAIRGPKSSFSTWWMQPSAANASRSARNAPVARTFRPAHAALRYDKQGAIVGKDRPLRAGELGVYSSITRHGRYRHSDSADQYVVLERRHCRLKRRASRPQERWQREKGDSALSELSSGETRLRAASPNVKVLDLEARKDKE
jgi:hypothetical protein